MSLIYFQSDFCSLLSYMSVIFCSSCQCLMLLSQKLRTVFLFKQDRNSIRRTIQLLKSELDKMVLLDFQQNTMIPIFSKGQHL